MALDRSQLGLTLLEVLIALSIFSMIGIAAYQVLNSTIAAQRLGDEYSLLLGQQQKALTIIDRDLQQIVERPIRVDSQNTLAGVVVGDEYPLQFTRAGQRNPLLLVRSSLQRVAYDVGLHPQVDNAESPFYRDEKKYLRRHTWQALDRNEDAVPRTQALLADVEEISVAVITQEGRHMEWPLVDNKQGQQQSAAKDESANKMVAIEFTWIIAEDNTITRLYPVL